MREFYTIIARKIFLPIFYAYAVHTAQCAHHSDVRVKRKVEELNIQISQGSAAMDIR